MSTLALLVCATPALADNKAENAIRIAHENGMETVHEVDRNDRRWEIEGLDVDGRAIEIDIDLASGEVLKIDRD